MTKGVLLMAYGTPRTLGEVEAYYTHIRGGRKPTAAELDNLMERYRAIGGLSPLIRITESERDRLQDRLRASGSSTRVYSAMKHSPPFIADAVRAAAGEVDGLLAIALAPHYSSMSIGSYMRAVEEANASLPRRLKLETVLSWHDNPRLIQAWAERVERARKSLPDDHALVFSAHSLPERILAQGDPYKEELLETSRLVAERLGREDWTFSFQSAGHTSEPWLGPDLPDHLQALYEGGERNFLIAPIGFVSDHLEILFDIDVECKQWADAHGARIARCESMNDSDDFIECLYSLVTMKDFQ
jgi:ferrochelatase